ncbi:hypothetical protein MTO96_022348 [Rhipicephalus appendiculatus]
MTMSLKKHRVADSVNELYRRHGDHSSPSLVARSFWFHGCLCRLCGCFFIRAFVVISFLTWLEVDLIADKANQATGHGEMLTSMLRVFMNIVLLLRMIVNYLCMSVGATKLAAFYARASAFEKRIGTASWYHVAAKRFLWSDILRACLCVIVCTGSAMTLPKQPLYKKSTYSGKSPLMLAYFWLRLLVTVILYFVYDSSCIVVLKTACEVLAEYMRSQLRTLKVCLSLNAGQPLLYDQISSRIEAVRLNVFTISQLKGLVNDIWHVPLIVTSFSVLLMPCTAVYEVCREGSLKQQHYSLLLFSAWSCYEFVTLTIASQSLVNAAKELRDFCKSVRRIDDDYCRNELEHLHDSIDPEDLSLKGADFFRLKMSLLVSMAASVITYTVILVQTSQSFKN